jgi:Lon protease-like protein
MPPPRTRDRLTLSASFGYREDMPMESSTAADGLSPSSIPDCIPVFPLPNIVFFPKTYLPLHIFEPRYRAMVADAAMTGGCIGMALLREGWQHDYEGTPPVYEIGCVGRLISTQRLPDGRSNIVLQGLHRYRIHEENHQRSYRQARISLEPYKSVEPLDPLLRAELLHRLRDYVARRHTDHVWGRFLDSELVDDVLVNTLSAYLDFTPIEKQLLLEADTVAHQARRLNDLIQFKLYERDGSKGWT